MASSADHAEFIQHVRTPLNACSLEILPTGVEVSDARMVWPMMLGCYQLDERSGEREGHLDLYAVPIPEERNESSSKNNPCHHLGFGKKPLTILGGSAGKSASGILDGKWCHRRSTKDPMVYATAHADGEIQLHHITASTAIAANSEFPLQVAAIGKSAPVEASPSENGLCLALSWDFDRSNNVSSASALGSQRIVSSYSNGRVALHNVHCSGRSASENSNDTEATSTLSARLDLVESWAAHKMFQSPAEVWAASFTTQRDCILTGGDEGQLKLWDLRAGTLRPMQTLADLFAAGVTVLSPHPRREHWVACGSYDETMAVLDLRSVSSSQPPSVLCHSDAFGGGMWRMKWHPHDDLRLLLGSMHGGCRVVDLLPSNDAGSDWNVQVKQMFTQHTSMVYGADWLVHQHPGLRSIEAATSCSFYDRALYLWKVKQ